jgi:hypothetical protein
MAQEKNTLREMEERKMMAKLKEFMTTDSWDILIRLMNKRVNELYREQITGRDSFETLRALHMREGKIHGLLSFFDDLEIGASNE